MKIALCYSGLASRFNKADMAGILSQLEGIKLARQVDIFVSAWNDGADVNEIKEFITSAMSAFSQISFGYVAIECVDTPEFSLKYNDEHTWSKVNKARAIYAMFKGMQNADRLRLKTRPNENYDLVIRARPDVVVQGDLNPELWNTITTNQSLAIFPKSYNFFHFWNPQGGMLCDQFIIAKPDIMKKIVDIADEIDEMCDAGCRFHPESLLWWKMRYGIGLPPSFNNPVNPWYAFQDFVVMLRGQIYY